MAKTKRVQPAPESGVLTAADREMLGAEFGRLEPLRPGLAERLLRYVAEGDEAEAVDELARLGPAACDALGIVELGLSRRVTGQEPPPWFAWFEDGEGRDAGVLLRLAKVVTAPTRRVSAAVVGRAYAADRSAILRSLNPPEWLQPLLEQFATGHGRLGTIVSHESRLSAALIERLLRADGHEADLLYRSAFPPAPFSLEALHLGLFGGLKGYGERVATHPGLVEAALTNPSASQRTLAVEYFRAHGVPIRPFLCTLVGLAVGSARGAREASAAMVLSEFEAALPHLLAKLESGTPEERLNAVRLLGGSQDPEARRALEHRRESETAPKVKAALGEILGGPAGSPAIATDSPAALSPIDVFRGVTLDQSVLDEITSVVDRANKRIAAGQVPRRPLHHPFTVITPDRLRDALGLLIQPTPWTTTPDALLGGLRDVDASAFDGLLRRAELTPLHAVRLLALSEILRMDPRGNTLVYFDFEAPLRVYRESHAPPLDLRALAAAFEASALDPLAIARMRVQPPTYRRLDWPAEAVWPYFAEHLDWLREKFVPSRIRQFDWTLQTGADLRQEILSVLALFPEPPAPFVDALWDVALGSSKVERPLAQRCLEKSPGYEARVLASIAGGQRQARVAAAEWAVRRRLPGTVEALQKALDSERVDAARSALIDALERLGVKEADTPRSAATASDPRSELAAEAKKGLKSAIPQGLDWFPFDTCPALRWEADDEPVGRPERDWLIVQAWKAKTPEPTAMLRRRASLLRDDDAERFGRFVLETWLARDLRPPAGEEVKKRLAQWDEMFGALANLPGAQEWYQKAVAGRDAFLQAPVGSALPDKGLLAIVAACTPPSAAATAHAYINQWYGHRVHQCRALVQMLAWTDRPEAVEVLLAIAKRFRTKSIRQEAETQAKRLAERRGCSVAQLADQALPDLGLGADGRLALDYGPRRFVAYFDDDGELLLEDESGAPIKTLPDPRKGDDPEKVERAKSSLADLRKRVKTLRKTVADRLYEAMCSQRAWRFADWGASFRSHPLAGRLCRRLIWSVDGGPTFRPLEDGSLTDVDENEVQIKPDATMRLAHALTLPDEIAARWRRHLADYEVEPLFDQLRPSPYRLSEGSRQETRLQARAARPMETEALRRLARGRGYDPQAFRIEDGGHLQIKHFPGAGIRAVIDLEPDHMEEQIEVLCLSFLSEGEGPGGAAPSKELCLEQVPPVLLSECVADLWALAGVASHAPE